MKGDFKLDFGDDDELQHPSDLTVTREGDLAIADCGQLGVKLFTAYGTFISQFGNEDVFSLPISLTTDQLGRFIVLDQDRQMQFAATGDAELVRIVRLLDAQRYVVLQLAIETLADLSAGQVFPVAAGERRLVHLKRHRDRRLVHR